jgi:hypothetical protein
VLLIASVGVALFGPHPLAHTRWWAGSLGQFVVTVWVLGRCWGRPAWAAATLSCPIAALSALTLRLAAPGSPLALLGLATLVGAVS